MRRGFLFGERTQEHRPGVWARSFWRAGQRGAGNELCPEPVDQSGREIGDESRRRGRRVSDADSGGFACAEEVESAQRNLSAEDELSGSQKMIYELLKVEGPRPIDDIVETCGLNSMVVLATLFDLEVKGMVRQIAGKQFSKVLL
jgi:hypothetical protein